MYKSIQHTRVDIKSLILAETVQIAFHFLSKMYFLCKRRVTSANTHSGDFALTVSDSRKSGVKIWSGTRKYRKRGQKKSTNKFSLVKMLVAVSWKNLVRPKRKG